MLPSMGNNTGKKLPDLLQSIQEAETGKSRSLRLTWSIGQVPG